MALRIGIIGCGNIAYQHARGYLAVSDRARVTAVCDARLASAEELAQLVGGATPFSDLHEMLRGAELDAVDICLPHDAHVEAIVAAARAGRDILCEKPICLTRQGAETITEAIRVADVMFMCAHNQLFYPAVQKAKELLRDGFLGDVYEIRTTDVSRWTPRPRLRTLGWRANAKAMGGGELIDSGYHATCTLLHLAERGARHVTAVLSTHRLTEMDGEDSAQVLVELEGGTIGHIETSWAYEPPVGSWQFYVVGAGGHLYGTKDKLYFKAVGFEPAPVAIALPAMGSLWEGEIVDFVDCLTAGREPLQTVEDGIAVLRVLKGAYRAVSERRMVDLSEDDW